MVYKYVFSLIEMLFTFAKLACLSTPENILYKCKTVKSGGYELTLTFLCKASLACFRSVVPRT
ncbi:hypothetical protein Hanom_Chr06g00487611 [Helianthus anomalus]